MKKNSNLESQKAYFQSIMPYENIDETIKKYRKQMQCFRHSSEKSIAERSSYTDVQKNFFVDFGIVIVKTIHELKSRL